MIEENLIDIIAAVVATIPKTVTILSVGAPSGGKQVLTVCDPLYALEDFKVTIQGNDYIILAVTDDTITVKDTPTIIPGTFDLYNVHFFYGTPVATSADFAKKPNAFDKVPMIWMVETFSETFLGEMDAIERESDAKLYFLTSGKFKTWQTSDYKTKAIKPMLRLRSMFETALEESPRFDTQDIHITIKQYNQLGVYVNGKGFDGSVLVDRLTGVERSGLLRIYKKNDWKKDCCEC